MKSLVDKIIAIAFPSGIGDKARNRLEEAIPLVLDEVFSDREKALNDKEKTLLEKEKKLQDKISFFEINRDACKRQLHSFRKGLNAFVSQAEELLSLAVLLSNHPELKEEGDTFTLGELAQGVNPWVQQLDPVPDSHFPDLPEEVKDRYSAKMEILGKGLKWSDKELIKAGFTPEEINKMDAIPAQVVCPDKKEEVVKYHSFGKSFLSQGLKEIKNEELLITAHHKAGLDKRDVPFGKAYEKKSFLSLCGLTSEEFEDYQTRLGVDIIKDFEECRWERICSFCDHLDMGHCSLTREPVGKHTTCDNFKLFYSDPDKVLS